jgi:hypothetical protein
VESDDGKLSTFTAIEPLSTPNATLGLIFASFFGTFWNQSDDLWMPAHTPLINHFEESNGSFTSYAPDNPVSVLACLEQVQICNPSATLKLPGGGSMTARQCSLPNSFSNVTYTDFDYLFTSNKQKKIVGALIPLLQWSTFGQVMSSSRLLAESQVIPITSSLPLAPNQWILESKNLFTIGLATMQRMMIDFINGPISPYSDYVPKNQADNDTDLAWLCSNQIVRRNDYLNFSSLSLWLVVSIGLVVIVISLWLETFVEWAMGKGRWKMSAWWAEGMLQLQRRAFEGRGIGGWHSSEWARVPVTQRGRTFAAVGDWEELLPRSDLEEGRQIVEAKKEKEINDDGEKITVRVMQVDSNLSDM